MGGSPGETRPPGGGMAQDLAPRIEGMTRLTGQDRRGREKSKGGSKRGLGECLKSSGSLFMMGEEFVWEKKEVVPRT